ncbi:GAF domain-containing protein [Rhodopseudomonas boonkerdii]|nr:GAF domain-containing protein [Rhodopseudomonas boonkerdii]
MDVKLELPGIELLRRSSGPSLRAHIARERSVLMQVAAGRPLSDVLQELLRSVEDASRLRMMASVLEVSEDGGCLRHLAAPSLPAAYSDAIDGAPVGEGVGSCGTAAHRGTPVYVTDIASDPLWTDYRDLALAHGLRACWSTPIRGMDDIIRGTFAVYYDEPRSPHPHDLEAIAGITLTVALAIERHRTDMQLRSMRAELSALIKATS